MTGWTVTGEHLEGNSHGLLEILYWHVSGRTEKTTKTLSHISHKRHDFLNKNIEHKICVFIFSTNFVGNNPHSTEII
jgi:hypothetical protein